MKNSTLRQGMGANSPVVDPVPPPSPVVAKPPELSRRAKWMLVFFGSLLGIGIGVLVGFLVKKEMSPALPEGSSFENLSDFRKALNTRDARDTKADNSVSLRSIMAGEESDDLIYRLAPNLRVNFQGVAIRTNAHGLRGPERPLEKSPDVFRIALLGDSFAFGWGVEEEKIFATRLEDKLNASGGIGGKKVEVLNFGVPGYSTFQESALFQRYAMNFHPDAALVFFVENDFGLPFFIKNLGSVTEEMMTNNNFGKSSDSDDPEVQKKRTELISLLDANQALIRLANTCRGAGIPLFLSINPGKSAPKMVERLNVLRERPDIRHLWLRDEMLARIARDNIDPRTLTLKTDPHPSALKHEILADILLAKLRGYPDMR